MESDEARIGISTVIMNSEWEWRRKKTFVDCPVLLFWQFSRVTRANKEALVRIAGLGNGN
jgi:hypothetical protein